MRHFCAAVAATRGPAMNSRPRAPEFLPLNGRGRRLWGAILARYELSDAELVVLSELCRTLDRIDTLEALVVTDGLCVKGSTGQPRMHPGIGEARLQRVALAALARSLQLPEALVAEPDRPGAWSTPSETGRAAARKRWHPNG
jgi:hypothetical protein